MLAAEMGFEEPWLRDSAETVIDELLTATAQSIPALQGMTRDRLEREGSVNCCLRRMCRSLTAVSPRRAAR